MLSDAALPPSERADRAAAFQHRAVAKLRRSFQAGYPATLAELEDWKDEDIRVLDTNPEFRELVSQIEAKLRAAPHGPGRQALELRDWVGRRIVLRIGCQAGSPCPRAIFWFHCPLRIAIGHYPFEGSGTTETRPQFS